MARTRKKKDTNQGKGNNLRVAQSCESCKFSGFKGAYHGGKRITGLCLEYQSAPRINYGYSPDRFFDLLSYFHTKAREIESLDDLPTFDQIVKDMPYTEYGDNIITIWASYLIQTFRIDEFLELQKKYYYAAKRAEDLTVWAGELPNDLTLDDWPLMLAKYLKAGLRWYWRSTDYLSRYFNLDGQTIDEVLAPLKKEYERILIYHRGWRDYFKNSPVTKIKRTTVCDNYAPQDTRPQVGTLWLTEDEKPPADPGK